jgi:nucleoside-diphosphate-sugar epimerase
VPSPPSVAVTGACGRIGRALVDHLSQRGYSLTLVDRPGTGLGGLVERGTVREYDLAQEPPVGLFAGVEVVIHLAGVGDANASWESLRPANIEASYQTATAAMRDGCRRLIVASSVHAVSGSETRPVAPRDPVAPADLYGVTKCFVEALAFWCAHRGPMSAAAVRIGAFQPPPVDGSIDAAREPDVFIADSDLVVLLERAIDAPYRFALLHAAAPGRDVLLDTRATEELLGWRPEHRLR